MGWGPLFFGYFLAFVPGQNSLLSVAMMLIGGAFMLFGLGKLMRYCHTFVYALGGVGLMMALTLTGIVLTLVFPTPELLAEGAQPADWLRVISDINRFAWIGWLHLLAVGLFHLALAFGVKEIAMRVGVEKNAVRALRNLVMVGIYVLATVLHKSGAGIPYLYAISTLVFLIVAICNSVMLYSCYMRIAPAEGPDAERENAPKKPSRFGFVNRLRAKMQAHEQKAQEADRKYNEQRMREERERQLSRMSKRQRRREEMRERNQKK